MINFICTSATIANPKELGERLTGKPMRLVDDNGALSGRKHFVFYNPPIVNKPLNIRKSATAEVNELAKEFLKNKVQTIVLPEAESGGNYFKPYSRACEKEIRTKSIRGYQGGYLPKSGEIEEG